VGVLQEGQLQEVSHSELILRVQCVHHYPLRQKMSQWKDILVKKVTVIAIDYAVHLEVLRHLDLEVSKQFDYYIITVQ
jgi:hypothetical protein